MSEQDHKRIVSEQRLFEQKRRTWRCPATVEMIHSPYVRLGSDVIETMKTPVRCVHTFGWHEDNPGRNHFAPGVGEFPNYGLPYIQSEETEKR